MYVRKTTHKNKDGFTVAYLYPAENVWGAEADYSKVRLLYSFGQVDKHQIRRLVQSLARFLSLKEARRTTVAMESTSALDFMESRPWGGARILA